jgi:hypothetical protein
MINPESAIIFTNARDEPNIAEWVAHHLLLGFDQAVVFDHQSVIPITRKIQTTFDNRLTILRVKGSGNIKIELMKHAVNIAKKRNKQWMLYIDADEFVCLNSWTNIKDFLKSFRQADSIGVNWLFYGTSGHKTQPQGLLTENFIRSELRLDQHVKSFVRPNAVKGVENPHYYVLKNPIRSFSANKTPMIERSPFNKQALPFVKAPAYIAHYHTQSEAEFLRRKSRTMDDGTVFSNEKILGLTHHYNDVVNNQLQNKYSGKTKEFLLQHRIVL